MQALVSPAKPIKSLLVTKHHYVMEVVKSCCNRIAANYPICNHLAGRITVIYALHYYDTLQAACRLADRAIIFSRRNFNSYN